MWLGFDGAYLSFMIGPSDTRPVASAYVTKSPL